MPLVGGLAVAALYVPAAVSPLRLGPDEVEYIDIARHLVDGQGYTLSVKAFHFGGTRVVHDGLAERAPLVTLLIALFIWLGLPLQSIQVANALFVGTMCGAIGWMLRGSRPVAATAMGLIALNPVVLDRSLPPMTEATSIMLMIVALALWSGAPNRAATGLMIGGLLGLAYLARPTTLALTLALVGWAVLTRRRVAWAVIGFGIMNIPLLIHTGGNLLYSGQQYLFAVFADTDVLHDGYQVPVGTAREFVRANWLFVLSEFPRNTGRYTAMLLGTRDMLLPLLPAVVVGLIALRRVPFTSAVWGLLAMGVVNLLVSGAIWSTFVERYMLVSLVSLLVVVALAAKLAVARGRAIAGLAGVVAAVVLTIAWGPRFGNVATGVYLENSQPVGSRVDDGVHWTGPSDWVNDRELDALVRWLEHATGSDSVVASAEPWPLTFLARRPSTLLPRRLTADRLESFVREYRVAHVVLRPNDRNRRPYAAFLEARGARLAGGAPTGNYAVFDTRPLWR